MSKDDKTEKPPKAEKPETAPPSDEALERFTAKINAAVAELAGLDGAAYEIHRDRLSKTWKVDPAILDIEVEKFRAAKPKKRGRGEGRRFKKGESGNPGGRPASLKSLIEYCREEAPALYAEAVKIAKDRRVAPRTRLEAISIVGDRAHGRPSLSVAVGRGGDIEGEISEEATLLLHAAKQWNKKALEERGKLKSLPAPATEAPSEPEAPPLTGVELAELYKHEDAPPAETAPADIAPEPVKPKAADPKPKTKADQSFEVAMRLNGFKPKSAPEPDPARAADLEAMRKKLPGGQLSAADHFRPDTEGAVQGDSGPEVVRLGRVPGSYRIRKL
jgi:hypothetical protein